MNIFVLSRLICITVFVTLTLEGATGKFTCDDGWVTFADKCYKFIQEEENFHTALAICHSMASILAYTKTDTERDFLSSYVKGLDVYAWMTGVQWDYFRRVEYNLYRFDSFMDIDKKISLPEYKNDPDGNLNCIAYRPPYKAMLFYSLESGMTTVDCHVKLPYVCRGDPSTVTSTGSSNWIKNGTKDIFWVSDPTAKLNYSDAEGSCKSKGMTLLSIRSPTVLAFIDETLKSRSINKVEPWWTSLHIPATANSGSRYTWAGNVPMDESVILWLPFPERVFAQRVLLLGSGEVSRIQETNGVQLPFICMKNVTYGLRYGCPSGWTRAGGSCYRGFDDELTWTKADQFCSTSGSHLLSIDSKDEMQWLKTSKWTRNLFYGWGSWTSLNDRKRENHFVWSDGSKLDTGIVDWLKPIGESSIGGRGNCVRMYGEQLVPFSCVDTAQYGCQYKTSNGACNNNAWKYFNGYCYSLTTSSGTTKRYVTFKQAKAVCKAMVAGSDINPDMIKIETKDVYNFLVKEYEYIRLGLGLNSLTSPGEWKWADGSEADLSIFPNTTEPSSSRDGVENHCVAMTKSRSLYTMPCDSVIMPFMCEKEIKLTRTPVGSQHGQASRFKPSQAMSFIAFILVMRLFM